MAPDRQQAIIWTSEDLGYRRIYASLDLNEVNIHECDSIYQEKIWAKRGMSVTERSMIRAINEIRFDQ